MNHRRPQTATVAGRTVEYKYWQTLHKAQHDAFVAKFKKLTEDPDQNGPHPVLTISVQRTVSEWLLNHIAKVDTQLAAHLNSKAA